MKQIEVKQRLKDLGSSWDKFEKEYDARFTDTKCIFEFICGHEDWNRLISNAFSWQNSTQGSRYWNYISLRRSVSGFAKGIEEPVAQESNVVSLDTFRKERSVTQTTYTKKDVAKAFDFKEDMRRNMEMAQKQAEERTQNNKGITRSFRLKR